MTQKSPLSASRAAVLSPGLGRCPADGGSESALPRRHLQVSENASSLPSHKRNDSVMTFTEAAAQVLRLVGKPLHYKEITDVAIEKNLLSHVGKSPEVTMGARLAALVKKGDKENPLIRVKPGVFALREWDKETIEKGLQDRTPALERLAQAFGDQEVEVQATEEEPVNSSPEASRPIRTEFDEEDASPPD